MAKYNKKTPGRRTINYMGGKAFKQDAKTELAHTLLTSFIEDAYYEKKNKRLDRIEKLIKDLAPKDPQFVGKLVIYLRSQAHMRSSFHTIVAELAKVHRGDSLVARVIENGVERPDDLIEILACFGGGKGKIRKIPNQIKKGIRKALNKFDAYQLAKYRAEGKAISMVDLFNLVHPVPTPENVETWNKLMRGELTTAGKTWEARKSAGESNEEMWLDMLKNRKLGYMACLRNLRNIIKGNNKEAIRLAAKFIQNPKAIANSKQLPFRFLSAYAAIAGEGRSYRAIEFEKDCDGADLIDALNKAVQHSVNNIPLLKGKTVILVDNSGSMRGDMGGHSLVSAYSHRTSADIANLFATLYWSKAENTWIGLFGDRLLSPKLDREASIFDNYKKLNTMASRVGPGTETGIFEAFEQFLKDNIKPERIVIFSDCQVGTGCKWYDVGHRRGSDFNKLFQKFRTMSPETLVYSIDLRGYGNTLFADGVIELAGWSDRIFDAMQIAETDGMTFIKQIENIQI